MSQHKCPSCGFEFMALRQPVEMTTFAEFLIPREVVSMNARMHNSGPARHAYRIMRASWTVDFDRIRMSMRLTTAVGMSYVAFERRYASPRREWDHDNLVGGMKPVVDAMVAAKLIAGDSPGLLEATYSQRKVDSVRQAGLHVRLMEPVT